MHTTIANSAPTLDDLKQVMIRIQIAALETLERCMQNLEPTGDDKKDRAAATALNRQRMSATQTLLHCRTMFRELREAELQDHRITQEKKQAEKKAIFDLANLRYLHRIYPHQYDNPDAPGTSRDRKGAASYPPSPTLDQQSGEGGRASDRMRGRDESCDDQNAPPLGAMVGAEGAGHANFARPSNPSTYTPKLTRSKPRKPKHPRQSRKRKRKQRRG